MLMRVATIVVSLLLLGVPLLAQPPTTAAQDGFVPAGELPPGQQLPAAPFLVGAYAFFLALMLFYLWTIWRRIGRVEKEMRALERRAHDGGR